MPSYSSIQELQEIDAEIDRTIRRIDEFAPLLDAVESRARKLEAKIERTRGKLRDLRVRERRLELTASEKRNRLKMLQDRLSGVHNLRQEAAVRVEIDLVSRSADGDEQEAFACLDQIRRFESEAERLEKDLASEVAEAGPKKEELFLEQRRAEDLLKQLEERREMCAGAIEPAERRIYESLRATRKGVIVVPITADGACGRCFSMVPLQVRAEVRHGRTLRRCDACGIILAPGDAD